MKKKSNSNGGRKKKRIKKGRKKKPLPPNVEIIDLTENTEKDSKRSPKKSNSKLKIFIWRFLIMTVFILALSSARNSPFINESFTVVLNVLRRSLFVLYGNFCQTSEVPSSSQNIPVSNYPVDPTEMNYFRRFYNDDYVCYYINENIIDDVNVGIVQYNSNIEKHKWWCKQKKNETAEYQRVTKKESRKKYLENGKSDVVKKHWIEFESIFNKIRKEKLYGEGAIFTHSSKILKI